MKAIAEEVSLYIHIPFCISKCSYCDFFSLPYKQDELKPLLKKYIEALCNEISFRLSFYNVQTINTIYIGGGTPSLLKSEDFIKLFDFIKKSEKLAANPEITVEVNPDDVNQELLETLQACGVNRISCGIQSMNDIALKKACRRADSATNRKAISLIKEKWKGDISFDLISGLPGDDEKSLLAGLEEVISYNPSHISLYSLTIEEKTPFGHQLQNGLLDYDFDLADKLWLSGRDFLESKGYKWYEVSNFCLEGKECSHNLVYWNHKSYLGCGAAACGTFYNDDGTGFRWTNTTNIKEYIDFWNQIPNANLQPPQSFENIDKETSQFEFFMMGLRKLQGVCESDYKTIFEEDLPERFVKLFSQWEEKGLCVRRGNYFAMSRQGMLFLNRFNMELL